MAIGRSSPPSPPARPSPMCRRVTPTIRRSPSWRRLGIINPGGVNGSGRFEPERDVKRAEMAAFVARIFGWDKEFHANNFPDKCDRERPELHRRRALEQCRGAGRLRRRRRLHRPRHLRLGGDDLAVLPAARRRSSGSRSSASSPAPSPRRPTCARPASGTAGRQPAQYTNVPDGRNAALRPDDLPRQCRPDPRPGERRHLPEPGGTARGASSSRSSTRPSTPSSASTACRSPRLGEQLSVSRQWRGPGRCLGHAVCTGYRIGS